MKLHIKLKTTPDIKLALGYVQLEVHPLIASERTETSRFWFLNIYFEIQAFGCCLPLKMGIKICCPSHKYFMVA